MGTDFEPAYSYSERLHPCPRCLEPLDIPIEGGEVTCRCGERHRAGARDHRRFPRSGLDAAAQLAALTGQPDPTYLDSPTAIALAGSKNFSSKDSVGLWQRVYVAALASPGDEAALRALVHFTLGCLNSVAYERGRRVARAMAEANLDLEEDPDTRQDLFCLMARGAAREGDLESAERWLAPCDPRSTEVRVDSSYRLSRATIDVQSGDPSAALAVLGDRPGVIPIGSRSLTTAALVRAHALELLGRDDEAVRQLRDEMVRRDPGGHAHLGNVLPVWAPLVPCPRTFPIAAIEHIRPQLADSPVAAMFGGGFAALGLFLMVTGGVAVVFAAATSNWPFLATGFLPAGLGVVFFLNGRRRRDIEARTRAVRASGEPARARIQSVEHLGPSSGSYAHVRLTAELHRDGVAPYTVAFEAMRYQRNGRAGPWVVPYAWLPVRVDPADPSFVVPDIGR
ncbi:MAG: hypothetical protein U0271_23675 [Polyangiaceae bacterium]